jgi:D-alanyl-D-alanine carboxypeptidase
MLSIAIMSSLMMLSACAKTPHVNPDLESKLISIAKKNHIPTLSVIVKSANTNLNFKYQDGDKGIEPIAIYGLASTTKFLSALLVMKQIEENKIGLDDLIHKYIDKSALENISWFNSITVKQLLNHTSGIPDYTKNPKWIDLVMNGNPPLTYSQKVSLINATDGAYQLGIYSYSNSNYVILERIIETVGRKNAQQVFNEFFLNHGISNLSFAKTTESNQAFFSQQENQINNATDWQENYGFEGGAYSNANDLSIILRKVFIDKRVLNQNSLDLLTTWTDVNKYTINYGFAQMSSYGLGLMKFEFNGRVFLGHAGSSLKYQCFAFIEPATGAEIILQTNCSGKYYNNVFFISLLGEIIKKI